MASGYGTMVSGSTADYDQTLHPAFALMTTKLKTQRRTDRVNQNWISNEARDALWFSAKIRFELTREGSNKREYEDRVYLFQCPNPEAASNQAIEIGKQQEHEYKTEAGKQLKWQFVSVLKVMMTFLDTPLERGIEIYSEKNDREAQNPTQER